MQPFFEAGLKDLAVTSGYPSQSIQGCSPFQRTHHFIMEVWEAMLTCMLQSFLQSYPQKPHMEQEVASTLQEFEKDSYDELALCAVIRAFEEGRSGFDKDFRSYAREMAGRDDTWKFWSRFVFEDCQPYISLFIALRSENWHHRMASLKSMASDFTAFDHPMYQRLITQHIVDVLSMPPELIQYLEKGGFALSISGKVLHSVALDESHEMLINKHIKGAITRPSKDYMNRIAQYIPFRMKSVENLKNQLFPPTTKAPTRKERAPIMLAPDKATLKSAANIKSMIERIKDCQLFPPSLPTNRGLLNPFSGLIANAAQSHDLLNFHEIGRENFEQRIKAYVLKNPSIKVPQRRKKLQTFATTSKKGSKKNSVAQQELKRIQKCMRRKIAYANKTGTNPDVIGQQYIEFPRALCTTDGLPVKGQKCIATSFYQARYKETQLITHCFPNNWQPESAIIDGMFLLNTKPLNSHKVMTSYGNFLMDRFILPYFRKGCEEVHLLFDDPGRQPDNPKQFEQTRRDAPLGDHTCFIFFDDAEVPANWRSTVNCRPCKRKLTIYLSGHFVKNIRKHLSPTQKFYTSGAAESSMGVVVTKRGGDSTWTAVECRVDEADTRVWLHLKHSAGTRKFILSPDTDVYHIGLPLLMAGESIYIQVSRPSDKELKLLHLNTLIDVLRRDPDLVHIPESDIPRVFQTLFVATGCDYVSEWARHSSSKCSLSTRSLSLVIWWDRLWTPFHMPTR